MSTIRKSPLDAKLHKIDSLCSIDQKYCSTKQVETKQNRDRKKCTNMMCTASSQFGLACSLHCIAYCIYIYKGEGGVETEDGKGEPGPEGEVDIYAL